MAEKPVNCDPVYAQKYSIYAYYPVNKSYFSNYDYSKIIM